MEKVAILELNESVLKLTIYKVNGFKSEICFSKSQNFAIGKEIEKEELLSPKTKDDILNMLKIYRKMIENYGATSIISVTTNIITKARNYRGFLDEIYNNTGLSFSIISEEEYVKYIFNAIVNSIDNAKGVFIYVGEYSSYIVKYNRRAILGSAIIPYGSYNTADMGKDMDEQVKALTKKVSLLPILSEIDEDLKVVGAGRTFIATGRIAKKILRYPVYIILWHTLWFQQ